MPAIIVPHRWNYKPSPGCEVDLDHPQAKGVKLWHPLNEGNLAAPTKGIPRNIMDSSASGLATVTGSPTWLAVDGKSHGGIGRGGYGTTAYDAIDPAIQVYGLVYPSFLAVAYAGFTSTAKTGFVSLGNTTLSNLGLYSRLSALGDVGAFIQGTSSSVAITASGLNPNDGNQHVVSMWSLSASNHFFAFDGVVVATSTTNVGTITAPFHTLGVNRVNVINSPMSTGSLLWHIAGNGSVPDMAWLAAEPYAAILPPATRRSYSYGATVTYQPHFLSLLGVGS